jgi:hypothetical protein
MEVLTNPQVKEWLDRISSLPKHEERLNVDEAGPFFAYAEASCIHLDYPTKVERLPFFARNLASVGYEECHFRGALVWITEWNVWNALEEVIGYRVVESLNRASGQPCAFEVGTGHAFRADELVETVGLLLQPMVYGWDAYYLPQWAYGLDEFFLHVSHDSYVTVITRTREFHDRVFSHLEKLELHPKRSSEVHARRFCHVAPASRQQLS